MHNLVRFSKFGLVGVLATLVHVAVFLLLVQSRAASPLQASVPAFAAALALSYTFNRSWTFSATGRHRRQLPRYASIAGLGLSMNLLIMYVVVDVLKWAYGAALALVVLSVPLATYFLNRRWTFREARP